MSACRKGWHQFEGAEWEEHSRGSGVVLVIPSDTDPAGSETLRAQTAAAHDEADRLAAILAAGGTIPNTYDEYREAAE